MKKNIEIIVCMGSACFARGNEQNLAFIESYVKQNEIDAKIELSGSRCEGKCADGPNVIINGEEYRKINEEKLKEILDSIVKE